MYILTLYLEKNTTIIFLYDERWMLRGSAGNKGKGIRNTNAIKKSISIQIERIWTQKLGMISSLWAVSTQYTCTLCTRLETWSGW